MRTTPTTSLSAILLESLDSAWDPLLVRTEGMDDDEYAWEPAPGCWTVRRRDDDTWVADWEDPDPVPAPITTIAWRCWHIAVDCLDGYSSRVFRETGTGLIGASWVGTWPEASPLLSQAWSVFRAGVVSWGDEDLMTPLGPDWGPYENHSHLDLALHAKREIIHHGAEIALLRDLYRLIG
jgi:hypothetical protein